MSDYISLTAQQLAAKLATLRYVGLSYHFNMRNAEFHWYAEIASRIDTAISGLPCTVVAPQCPIQLMVAVDEAADPDVEGDDNSDDESDSGPAVDPDASIHTITDPLQESKVPDFCIVIADCQPDNTGDDDYKKHVLGHRIEKTRVATIVECKRHPKRSLTGDDFDSKLTNLLLQAQSQALGQGMILFEVDQTVPKVHLVASSGHYWKHVTLTRDNASEGAGGPNASYVPGGRRRKRLLWSETMEMGTPESDKKLRWPRDDLRKMQKALCKE